MHSPHSRITSDLARATAGVLTTRPFGLWCIRLVAVSAMAAALTTTDILAQKSSGALTGSVVERFAYAARISSSPAVGTVVDRQFVENLALYGRSLQDLLELTPGVMLTSVTTPSAGQRAGAFGVNGQRSGSNSFTVDGVSASVDISSRAAAFPVQSGLGQLADQTVLNNTDDLLSVDGLTEFRINTSLHAPEFGRTPGGQISTGTRFGTNSAEGGVSEYFRYDTLGANDWFINNRSLDEPKLLQHNIGAVIGDLIRRSLTFVFASCEGLRLEQPLGATVNAPSVVTGRTAVSVVRPYPDRFPLPNGSEFQNGVARFCSIFSDPFCLDITNLDLDVYGRKSANSFAQCQINRVDSVIVTSTPLSSQPGREYRQGHYGRLKFERVRATIFAGRDVSAYVTVQGVGRFGSSDATL